MTDPAFTVLLPVHRPPALLPYAIASVLAQQRRDLELFVVCDGAPLETVEVARRHAAADPRVRVFEHPKGERHGEAYRDQALRHARGGFICQIADDDLWFPNHLDEISRLLDDFDFGNLSQVDVMPDGMFEVRPGNLADAGLRRMMLTERFNFFGPTAAGYRIEAYRTLPIGWSPAPLDFPTDLFMWRKFLAQDELRFGSRITVTSLKFKAGPRKDWSLEQRRSEVAAWAARLSGQAARDLIAQSALCRLSQSALDLTTSDKALGARITVLESQLRQANTNLAAIADRSDKLLRKLEKTRQSWSWRLTRPFRKLARRIGRRAAG